MCTVSTELNFLLLKTVAQKKVLLRERKRHTARRVASARYAALSRGGGVPYPRVGGTPVRS